MMNIDSMTNEDKWNYVLAEIGATEFGTTTADMGSEYNQRFMHVSKNLSFMLPSPLVQDIKGSVRLKYDLNKRYPHLKYLSENEYRFFLEVKGSVTLRPEVHERLKKLDSKQFVGREKFISVSSGCLRYNEKKKREYKFRQGYDVMKEMEPSTAKSLEIAGALINTTFDKYFNGLPSESFLHEHSDKSLVGRRGQSRSIKWEDLDFRMSKKVEEARSLIKDTILHAFNNQLVLQTPYDTGERSRMSVGLPGFNVLREFYAAGYEDVSRIVFFLALWSMGSAFISNHAEWYKSMFDNAMPFLWKDCPYEFDSPLWNGAKVYERVHRLVEEGCELITIDGEGWDGFSARLVGPGLACLWTQFSDIDQNTSGNILTSIINMCGTVRILQHPRSLELLRKLKVKLIVILSDDIIIICERNPTIVKELLQNDWLKGVVGFSDEDYKLQFMLGYSFAFINKERGPVFAGLHCISENRDHRINLSMNDDLMVVYEKTGKHQPQEVETVLQCYESGMILGKYSYEFFDLPTLHSVYSPRQAALDSVLRQSMKVT